MSQWQLAKSLGFSLSTVQNVLAKYKKTLTIEKKSGSGRRSGAVDKGVQKRSIAALKRNPNVSLRVISDKARISPSTVYRNKKRAGLKSY